MFDTDSSSQAADQLRKDIASALPKIIAESNAMEELKVGANAAALAMRSFHDQMIEISQGGPGAYTALQSLDIAFTQKISTIFGDTCVDCSGTGVCKWRSPRDDECTAFCRSGPVTFQYGWALLHIVIILESAKQAPKETQTPEYMDDMLNRAVRTAGEYGALLNHSMSTWSYHGLDEFHCHYDVWRRGSNYIGYTWEADLAKQGRIDPLGIDFVEFAGCETTVVVQCDYLHGCGLPPRYSPCEVHDLPGFDKTCYEGDYPPYREHFFKESRKAWEDLIQFLVDIGNMKSCDGKPTTSGANLVCRNPSMSTPACCPDGSHCQSITRDVAMCCRDPYKDPSSCEFP
jgi:hypothetical protein